MSYKIQKLEQIDFVKSADAIMKPIFGNIIREVEVNSINAVVYSIYGSSKTIDGVSLISDLCKPISNNRKVEITAGNKGLLIKFFGANNGNDIWLEILFNGDNQFYFFLS
jgi:hypothetical protein